MDAKLLITKGGHFTIGIENGDLFPEDGFDTAINLSLFSDARASDDRILDEKSRRGTLRDLVVTVQGRTHGSLLWLLEQSKLTPSNRNLAALYSQKALNWIAEDGLAKSIVATAEIIPRYGFRINIVITANDGSVTNHYRDLWELTGTVIKDPTPIIFNIVSSDGFLIISSDGFIIQSYGGLSSD